MTAFSIVLPRSESGARTFEPQIIKKHILAESGQETVAFVRGMTARNIQSHLQKKYSAAVSSTLISSLTDVALDDVVDVSSHPGRFEYPTQVGFRTVFKHGTVEL